MAGGGLSSARTSTSLKFVGVGVGVGVCVCVFCLLCFLDAGLHRLEKYMRAQYSGSRRRISVYLIFRKAYN